MAILLWEDMSGGVAVQKDQQLTAISNDRGVPWHTPKGSHSRLISIFVNFIIEELEPTLCKQSPLFYFLAAQTWIIT